MTDPLAYLNRTLASVAHLAHHLLAGLATAAVIVGCSSAEQATLRETAAWAEKPNVILIVSDDQGYGDFGINSNPAISTPNLDQLARDSVYFTNFHVDPTCSPTRAALMTGMHSMRAGVWHTIMGRSLLPTEHVTLAEYLQENGYETAIFGKWHLGDNYPFRPQDQGFGEVLIHGGGGVGQTPDVWGNTQFDDTYFRNGALEAFEGYATDIWFDVAAEFILENRDKPFFIYLALNAPHKPWRVPAEYVAPYEALGLPREMARFFGMITHMDGRIGQLRELLVAEGLDRNTIVIFMSDNGSALTPLTAGFGPGGFQGYLEAVVQSPELADWTFNGGLRGFKTDVYDGGHRVPLFILMPEESAVVPRRVDALTAHFDLLPTILELTGTGRPEGSDGRSLVPDIYGEQVAEDRTLVVTNQRLDIPSIDRPSAVMTDRWRYVSWGEKGLEELYDMNVDRRQTTNVIDEHPVVAKTLRGVLRNWWADVTASGFKRQRIRVGDAAENPVRLTAMDWMEAASTSDVPWFPGFATPEPEPPYARWLDRESEFDSLPWYVRVTEPGTYKIALYFHDKSAATPVRRDYAVLELDGETRTREISKWSSYAEFTVRLEAGDVQFRGWFSDTPESTEAHLPAFYSYVERQD